MSRRRRDAGWALLNENRSSEAGSALDPTRPDLALLRRHGGDVDLPRRAGAVARTLNMQTNLRHPQQLFAQPIRYEVPDFQRRYVWKQDEQWEPLWDDVADLAQSQMEDGSEAHFMGAVVLQPARFDTGAPERRIVVDGQQRLTTLQLLIDAVQEVLAVRGFSGPARRLAALVENQDAFLDGDKDKAFKVWPTAVDRDAFRSAMQNDLSAAEHAASRIVQAHDYFKGQAGQWLDTFDDQAGERAEAAKALEEALRTKLELVVIDLGGSDDPHMIFETLNARGTPLLQSDMVKNRILYDAKIKRSNDDDDRSPEEQQLWPFDDDWWNKEVGRGLQRRPRIDVFLNHWLTLRNRSETKPYKEFRVFGDYANARSRERETVLDIAKDIGTLGRLYRDVEELRRESIASFLERRNAMNVGVVTPLVLWLLSSDVPQATLANCVRAVESFLVRRVVCGYSARSYGQLFVGLLAKLATSQVETADGIVVSYLAEPTTQAGRWPDDQELRDRFVTAPLYQWLTPRRLRMVLTGIEEHLRTPMAESQDAPRDLHIEHIMPQAWHEHWPLPLDADAGEATANRNRAVHAIGNLTLANGRLNPSLSNAPWNRKREALADHSVMFLNKRLVNDGPDTWDEQAIEDRAKWLHERAVEVWPHADGFDAGSQSA